MRKIGISDVTLKINEASELTFREKLEIVKLLDRLKVDVIELPPAEGNKANILFVKSVSKLITDATLSLQCGMSRESIDEAVKALEEASSPRIQLQCPVSTVQMEYLMHRKPDKLLKELTELISYAKDRCKEVEFCALDATRSDPEVLYAFIKNAVEAGAGIVTVSDDAGDMLPDEYADFIAGIFENVTFEGNAVLSVSCSDRLTAAEICSNTGAVKGAGEIKVSAFPGGIAGIQGLSKIIVSKWPEAGLFSGIKTVELSRVTEKIDGIINKKENKHTSFENGVRDEESDRVFTSDDSFEEIKNEVIRLGYDLNDEDYSLVYRVFREMTEKKGNIASREIDAIVASNALQVPPVYKIKNFVITTGNAVASTVHMWLFKGEELLESVSWGDGSIDAAFLAIERCTGHHYELDDFQIRAVTEGRTAMGESIVKLRASGKIYSGRGLSTDIVTSGIMAYINALNKIAYEEENA